MKAVKAKQISNEELFAKLEQQIHWYRDSWTTALSKLRDCERECDRLRTELARVRDVDDGR